METYSQDPKDFGELILTQLFLAVWGASNYAYAEATLSQTLPEWIGSHRPNLGDPTLADAICDRLLHNAYKIEMRGDSMRTRRPVKTEKKEAIEKNVNLN